MHVGGDVLRVEPDRFGAIGKGGRSIAFHELGMTALHKYGPGVLAFLGFWVLLLAGGRSNFFRDPGTFWHTVVGRTILDTGHFFDRDPFSGSHGGEKWIPHQWLGECMMALVHRLDGLDSLLLATVTVLSCLYTWMAHRLMRSGLHWPLTGIRAHGLA